jgi:integrase
MRVAELDLEGAAWNIPGARMKRGRDHCVPLSRPAVALLRAMLPYAREGLVFPGYGASGALTTTATLKHLRALGFEGVTVHGFRALARTALAEPPFSFPADVLEAQLSHAKESAIVAAYDRGDRFEQRREVVEKWAEYLEKLRPGWLPVYAPNSAAAP